MTALTKRQIGLVQVKKMNRVRKFREEKMMSKAELARQAGVTAQTINRIEKGYDCRVDTKRKILFALGFELSDRARLFSKDK